MKKTSDEFLKGSYVRTALMLPALLLVPGMLEGGAVLKPPGPEKAVQPAVYYNFKGKPDPFRPFVEKDLSLKKKAENAKVTSIFPLQRAGVDQFNLVGIAGDAHRRLAILEAKGTRIRFYPVAVGTLIGLNNGKVAEIDRDRIVIEEVATGPAGRKKINRIIKRLHKDEEEGTQ